MLRHLALCLVGLHAAAAYTRPNLIMILADDIGWSDFGYFGYDLTDATPTIDTLATEGIRLYAVYGQTACSPGRAAFLSGRYPMRFGMQKGAINTAQRKGIFINESLISDELKKAGYATAMVGKWHVGHAAWIQTPTSRGFDTYYGFMCSGDMGYLTKMNGNYIDLYHDKNPETDEYALSSDVRSSWLFEAKVEDFITTHRATYGDTTPFFLYYALQDPHTPLSSPEYFLESEPCASMTDETRQVYCGMIRCIDSSIEGMMVALSDNGYYANTIVFMAGDNGGAPNNGGYNWPMRGSKGTLYEGGIRQAAWVWSSLLSQEVRGQIYNGQIHLVDMMPTFLGLATGGHWQPPSDKQLDGYDVWEAISTLTESPRQLTLLNVLEESGGLRMGNWSLLYNCKEDGWYQQPSEASTGARYIAPPQSELLKAQGDSSTYLYDVGSDPYQYTDVADSYPDVVEEMMTKLNEYISEAVDYNINSDKEDECSEVAAETGYWGPWLSDSDITDVSVSANVAEPAEGTGAFVNKGNLVQQQ